MAVQVAVKFPDAAALRFRVQETRKRGRSWGTAFAEGTEKLRPAIAKHFDTEGGGRWVGLSEDTVEARANRWGYYRRGFREGPAHRILHARHSLRRSLTEAGNRLHVDRPRGLLGWEFGTNDRRASFLHHGTSRGLPARPLIPHTAGKIVGEEMVKYITWAWRQRGPA